MKASIFKAYDIRGLVPSEVSEEGVERIGRAFATHLRAETGKETVTLAVGQDNRTHSPSLFSALTKGLMDAGANVVDIGLASTPFFYFAVSYLELDGGINVTASHNPPEYNGLKCVRKKAEPIGVESGLAEIRDLAMGTDPLTSEHKGTLSTRAILPDYIKKNLELIPLEGVSHLRVAIDTGNGISVQMIEALIKQQPLTIVPLYFELDGTFPNHMPNPLEEKNIVVLKKTVVEQECVCGIALDADGDRSVFIDERGQTVPSDILTALVAHELLQTHPNEAVVYDATSSWTTREAILAGGGKPVISRVGHSFIKAVMIKENALFAGERSGHFYFRFGNLGYFEAPLLVIATVFNLLASSGKTLSSLLAPFQTYAATGEINFEVQDKAGTIKKIESTYSDAKNISHLDGVTIEYDDWWCNVRPSNTEPLLRLNLEARTVQLRDAKLNELTNILQLSSRT